MNLLPLIGGFNDGKHIEPKGRNYLKMAIPAKIPHTINAALHYNSECSFEYEIYNLTIFFSGDKNKVPLKFYMIEGMTLNTAIKKMITGYKQFKKKKVLDDN